MSFSESEFAIGHIMALFLAFDLKEATKIICGSARSMGIEVKEWKKDLKDTK